MKESKEKVCPIMSTPGQRGINAVKCQGRQCAAFKRETIAGKIVKSCTAINNILP